MTPEKQEIGNFLGKLNIDPRKKRKLTQANHHRRNKHIAEAHHTTKDSGSEHFTMEFFQTFQTKSFQAI